MTRKPSWNAAFWTVKSASEKRSWLDGLSDSEAEALVWSWKTWARPSQIPPCDDWLIWLFLGGRGAGKTRSGAEWVRSKVLDGARRIALVGPTFADVREVMLSGASGLLNIGPDAERPSFEASRRRVNWPNGAVAYAFSAEDPDGLRGPQFDAAWADEFCAWAKPQETLDMLRLGLRLGDQPQLVMTTTPRPIPALKALMSANGVVLTHSATCANRANLAEGFVEAMQDQYGASHLARQELDGLLVDDPEGAVWTRDMIDQALKREVIDPERIVVAVDPPAGDGSGDECGIVVAGVTSHGRAARAVVLDDRSLKARPEAWAARVAETFENHDCDTVIAEANQGGDMVHAVLQAAASDLPVRLVHASRGKRARAEPIAAHYAAGRVAHAGRMPALEDQMCAFGSPDQSGSPDRVDALVWALSSLFAVKPNPRLRRL
jgi:predicted phage terminase large subunit-like protein